MTCYELCVDNTIKVIDFSVISQKVKTFGNDYLTDIDGMFRASEFLVSPLNTPEKFIRGEYFLTQAQEQIKKRILDTVSKLDTHGFVSLTGAPRHRKNPSSLRHSQGTFEKGQNTYYTLRKIGGWTGSVKQAYSQFLRCLYRILKKSSVSYKRVQISSLG